MEEDGEPGNNNTPSPSKIEGKGGFRATSFLYALTGLENMGVVANMVSLVLYFSYKMYFDLSTSANTLTNLMGSTYLLSVVGGFISDHYVNRFKCCLIFGTLEVLALSMMTIQAHIDSLLPKPCGKSSCVENGVAVYFYTTLCLLALGVGGLRGSLPAFGADQFDPTDPKEAKGLASYFNWLLLSSVTGGSIGVTFVVWVSTKKNNHNWWKGFLITAVGTFFGLVFLVVGKPFYRLQVHRDSPLTRITQVIVVAMKNCGLSHPVSRKELYEIDVKDSDLTAPKIAHTEQFRWLDKAAILPPNTDPSPWKVCTVTQVEQVKILTRMLPIIGSTIILNTCMAQLQTFSVQQGYRMDPHLGSSFRVPSASIPVIPLLFMIILIPIYDRLFVPCLRHFTKHPSGITQLQRVGFGLVLSALSMAIAGFVEVRRKDQSLKSPLRPISLFWLAFQYGIFGIADMFTLVGLLEFYYREAPTGMKSLSTSFAWISQSLGYFLSSVFVDLVNTVTRRFGSGGRGWLEGQDLDRNDLDLFYWFLAVLSGINFLNYLFWAMWYKYKNEDDSGGVIRGPATLKTENGRHLPFLKLTNGGAVVEEVNKGKVCNVERDGEIN